MRDLVAAHYTRPFRFRQNPSTVPISSHFNQLIAEATGEYFVLLADDDEISANYVSELAGALETSPRASVAIARQEIINEAGAVIRQSTGPRHAVLSGPDFIRAAWHTCEYRYECFATFLARTQRLRACGGYPEFDRGTHNDDALLVKLCLNDQVVVNTLCAFRWRVYEMSLGWSLDIRDLAKDSRQFLTFLHSDPVFRIRRPVARGVEGAGAVPREDDVADLSGALGRPVSQAAFAPSLAPRRVRDAVHSRVLRRGRRRLRGRRAQRGRGAGAARPSPETRSREPVGAVPAAPP